MGREARTNSSTSRTTSRIPGRTRERECFRRPFRAALQVPVGTLLGIMIRVCPLSELPPGTIRGIEQEGKRVLVVNHEGTLHAWDGTCTHEEADLSTGFLLGEEVT